MSKFKKLLLTIPVILIVLFSGYSNAIAEPFPTDGSFEALEIERTYTTTEEIRELVDITADKYGIKRSKLHYIVRNESQYDPNAIGDTKITCTAKNSPFYGEPVYARGLGQITRCYYPEITDEEAFDPVFNIEKTAEIISQGTGHCKSQFTTCKNYYNS